MSHHSSVPQIPIRDHMISAKAATLILRGIIAAGEPPNTCNKPERVGAPQAATGMACSEQQAGGRAELGGSAPGVPDSLARTTVLATDAKSTRPRRKTKADDGVSNPPGKKPRKA